MWKISRCHSCECVLTMMVVAGRVYAYRTLSWWSPDRASGWINDRSFPASRLWWKRKSQTYSLEIRKKDTLWHNHGVYFYFWIKRGAQCWERLHTQPLSRLGSSSDAEHGAWGVKDMSLCAMACCHFSCHPQEIRPVPGYPLFSSPSEPPNHHYSRLPLERLKN